MDAFFASVEQRDHPELKGKPLVVGGSVDQRGVVAAASYEARTYGIRSAMPMAKAIQLCPEVIRRPCDFALYKKVSDRIRAIFQQCTDRIEPVSLDEAYLDVSDQAMDFNHACLLAERIKSSILAQTQLTASIGIGPNKFLAKIASDYKKPNGFYVIYPELVFDFLTPLPIRIIPGIGQKTEQRLKRFFHIETVNDLRKLSVKQLQQTIGKKHGERLYELARGVDRSPVVSERERKSLSQERTFSQDIIDIAIMKQNVTLLSKEVAELLVKENLKGKTIGIKVKFNDFTIRTRALTVDHYVAGEAEIADIALFLMDQLELTRPVRLLGVRIAGFEDPEKIKQVQHRSDLQPRLWS